MDTTIRKDERGRVDTMANTIISVVTADNFHDGKIRYRYVTIRDKNGHGLLWPGVP